MKFGLQHNEKESSDSEKHLTKPNTTSVSLLRCCFFHGGGGDADSKKKEADRVREDRVAYQMSAEMPDHGQRYEIIDGAMEPMTPGPTAIRSSPTSFLAFLFR